MKVTTEVEYICEGGFGDEAKIIVQLRREFPGIGGMILTYQSLAVALRTEYNYSPHCGHNMFYKHAIIKKLEDYFFRTGVYRYPHVTRPLGSMDDSYIYEWAFGNDRFPWQYVEKGGDITQVHLDEWDRFVSVFNEAGIDMLVDCADPDDGRMSKNIVHQLARPLYTYQPDLNRIWKRVDFGDRSIRIDYDKLAKYLADNRENLSANLSPGRLDFIELTYQYLSPLHKITKRNLGRLEQLTLDYRMSTLAHINTAGVETSPRVRLRSK